jgi:ABC-type multidrug transport system fused ATPase/permease subunit
MENGRVIAQGAREQLLATHAFFRQLDDHGLIDPDRGDSSRFA